MKEKIKLPKVNAKGIVSGVVFVAGVITTISQVVSGVGELKETVAELKSKKKED